MCSYKFRSQKLFDPKEKRKQRIASYNAYIVEGKIKASIRKRFGCLKKKIACIVHGY
ncbi:hypothetical protein Leryth_016971 [Lithospermum erythrorhizon]|nr:hypothetical protein Leryth_016971 [Lithospermum erythrorhizon]